MTKRRLIGALAVAALGSVLVYAAVAFLTDASKVWAAILAFPPALLVAVAALTLVCFTLRAVRWGYLMRLLGTPMSAADTFYTQFSGMTMTVTPGKVGEILKAWLARRYAGLPMSRGIAAVFSERLADLIAVLFLSMGGLMLLRSGVWAFIAAAAVVVVMTLVASSQRFHEFALGVVSKQAWAKQHHGSASAMFETLRATLRPLPLLISVALSALSWGCEGIGFYLVLRGLGFQGFALVPAIAVYAVSTIIGALVFLPGGIGLTEASLAGLLVWAGATGTQATTATVLIRLFTLWWGVLLGWIVFATRPSVLRSFLSAEDAEEAEAEPAQ